jgi:foldase protein PrsA
MTSARMMSGRAWHAIAARATAFLALFPLAIATGSAIGCGDEQPPDDLVAKVGDTVITKADFERAQGQGSSGERSGGESRRLRNAVLETLIKAEWVRQEARARGIGVTNAEVQRALRAAKQSPLLSAESLKQAGLTIADIESNLRDTELQRKVTEALTAGSSHVSAQDIEDYYREHRAELRVEERRDLRLVLTKSRAEVVAARADLERGRPWKTVAMEYSLHPSRSSGGRVANLRKGPLRTPLVATAFRTREGRLTGPVRADESSWAIFVVDRIKPGFQATLERARDDIRDYLVASRRREALAAFTRKYREQTTCAPGFQVSACRAG